MAISAVQGRGPVQEAGGVDAQNFRARMREAMGAVAKKLGMSEGDLHKARESGLSLVDIAKSKGVSGSDLEKTIREALHKADPKLTEPQLKAQAKRIATHKATPHRQHHAVRASGASDAGSSPQTLGVPSAGQSVDAKV